MRNRSREISVALIMLLLAVLFVLAFLWALSIGTVKLSLVQIYEGDYSDVHVPLLALRLAVAAHIRTASPHP